MGSSFLTYFLEINGLFESNSASVKRLSDYLKDNTDARGAFEMSVKQQVRKHLSDVSKIEELLNLTIEISKVDEACAEIPVAVFGELSDHLTLRETEKIFHLFEDRSQDFLKYCATKGRRSLIRIVVDLLKRLLISPSHSTLKGRLQVFLASLLPLSDRTGFPKELKVDVPEVSDLSSSQGQFQPEEKSFFKQFWDIQQAFSMNWNLPTNAEKLKTVIVLVSDFLSTIDKTIIPALHPIEIKRSSPSSSSSSSSSSSMETEPVQDDEISLHHHLSLIRFLVNPSALSIQLKDRTFLSHFLVQCLIFASSTKQVSSDNADLDKKVDELHKDLVEKLTNVSEEGEVFVKKVLKVLDQEKFWVKLKAQLLTGSQALLDYSTNSVEIPPFEPNKTTGTILQNRNYFANVKKAGNPSALYEAYTYETCSLKQVHLDAQKKGSKNPKLMPILTWRMNQRWYKRISKETCSAYIESDMFSHFAENAFHSNKKKGKDSNQSNDSTQSSEENGSSSSSSSSSSLSSNVLSLTELATESLSATAPDASTPPADQTNETSDSEALTLEPPFVGEKRPRSETDDEVLPQTKIIKTESRESPEEQ